MKRIFEINFHKNLIKGILNPDFSLIYQRNMNPLTAFRIGALFLFYSLFVYFIFYLILFFIGYTRFSILNEAIQAEATATGKDGISIILNLYPWNVFYILFAIIIFFIFVSNISYILILFLEKSRIKYLYHLGICSHATSCSIPILFLILILNSLFPFDKSTPIFVFSFIMSIWIIFMCSGLFLMTRIFLKSYKTLRIGLPRRLALAWLIPIILFFKIVIGIIAA